MRLDRTPRTVAAGGAAHALPASTSSAETVLMDTSATRLMDRMEDPSTSMERIWMRLARGSLLLIPLF